MYNYLGGHDVAFRAPKKQSGCVPGRIERTNPFRTYPNQ